MTGQAPIRGRRAVFLDRDGVLNELVERDGQLVSPRAYGDFRLALGAADFVRRLRERGFLVFVITNQPDVMRGRLSTSDLALMQEALKAALEPDEIACCPHDDTAGCNCRKPKPGMILDLAARWRVNLSASFVIGDSWRDIAAGRAAGCRTVLVSSVERRSVDAEADSTDAGADWTVVSLSDALAVVTAVMCSAAAS